MQLYRFDKGPFRCVVNEGHRYLVPREDGRVLVGSCEEEVGFAKGTSQEMMDQLRSWALSVCPKIADAALESQWSGLRPGSIDTYPYLGTLYPYQNAFIAAGHFRHGLHWSAATAILMNQHMRGDSTTIDLEPFRVQRGNVQ
jgi:glycine oxidase